MAFIFIFIVAFVNATLRYSTVTHLEVTVTGTERIVEGSGENTSSRYLVFTEGEVFSNEDNVFFWKFNSSDVQNQLSTPGDYTIKVEGWRVPFLSWYRNILSAEPRG